MFKTHNRTHTYNSFSLFLSSKMNFAKRPAISTNTNLRQIVYV